MLVFFSFGGAFEGSISSLFYFGICLQTQLVGAVLEPIVWDNSYGRQSLGSSEFLCVVKSHKSHFVSKGHWSQPPCGSNSRQRTRNELAVRLSFIVER